MIRGSTTFKEWYRQNIYAVCIVMNHWLFKARPALNMPCQDKGMLTRSAEVIGCQGRTVVGERYGASSLTVRNSVERLERDKEPRGSPFSGHRLHGQPTLLHLLQCGMLIRKCSPCTAVMYQAVQ